MNIVIVIPTYNEVLNIGRTIDILVGKEFPQIKNHQMMLLVVDGHSTDGTGGLVLQKAKKYKNIFLLDEGAKRGLGMAYASGFRYAIDKLRAGAVMEMDSDLQHDPADVKRFVAELDRGYDYVLGSRFIKGGTIPKDWGLKRKFLSIVGNLFARSALFIWDIHDFTTGFRLARVKGFLEKIDFERIFPKSYAYKMLLLYQMRQIGARIREIPIAFASREKGWSKMDSEDFLESLKVIGIIWKERLDL